MLLTTTVTMDQFPLFKILVKRRENCLLDPSRRKYKACCSSTGKSISLHFVSGKEDARWSTRSKLPQANIFKSEPRKLRTLRLCLIMRSTSLPQRERKRNATWSTWTSWLSERSRAASLCSLASQTLTRCTLASKKLSPVTTLPGSILTAKTLSRQSGATSQTFTRRAASLKTNILRRLINTQSGTQQTGKRITGRVTSWTCQQSWKRMICTTACVTQSSIPACFPSIRKSPKKTRTKSAHGIGTKWRSVGSWLTWVA